MDKLVMPLRNLCIKGIPTVGGKAANLGELINAGFNVPGGFCITKDVFDFYMKNHKLPSSFEAELKKHLTKLKGPFAVRSSATTEDLKAASFAGQHDTFLNVHKDEILQKVKLCFSSLYSERAIAYRKHNKIHESRAKMAVVVQCMVQAEYSGVCFTLDPVHRKFLLMEIVKGLGEKLVSGKITPNSYFLDRKSFKVKEKNESHPVNINMGKAAETFMKIEKHYKMPMDIEFSFSKGRLFILQARPITT